MGVVVAGICVGKELESSFHPCLGPVWLASLFICGKDSNLGVNSTQQANTTGQY